MNDSSKSSTSENYYSGGFAEIVSCPSRLTYSFFKDWFTGIGSLGKAMEVLGFPYARLAKTPLIIKNSDLFVDLKIEEEILYKKTIFSYVQQENVHDIPSLRVNVIKLINPFCVFNTLKILLIQSDWIANGDKLVNKARDLLTNISEEVVAVNIKELDQIIMDKIWPTVIAIGLMSEFYNQLLKKEAGKDIEQINNYISSEIAKKDWFFASITDQFKVKNNQLSFEDFIKAYGFRSDKDYELLFPRWHELGINLKNRIETLTDNIKTEESIVLNQKLKKLADIYIYLQLIRSEAKMKALIYFDKLRQEILKVTSDQNILGQITKQDLLQGNFSNITVSQSNTVKNNNSFTVINSGRGLTVFAGKAEGIAKKIDSIVVDIAGNTIGIFPNASPEFAICYPKCKGMIFLKGGQTSHGAVVAREFKIPAIIDSNAAGISDGARVILDSQTGEWEVL